MRAGDLKKLQRNVYSQSGEDGIIEWIFGRIVPRHRICVEFGAWDGRNLSNTFNLVANYGWRAIYIEADPRRFRALESTAKVHPGITPVRSLVTASGDALLDRILERYSIPQDFDLLSIDIDGNDYEVWQATERFKPTLVVVEYNASFPVAVEFVDRGGRGFIGSSAAAFAELASRKGYGLLWATATNLLFLREPYFAALGIEPQAVGNVIGREAECYVVFNHAGEIVFSNEAVARKLRGVSYARPLKTWVRRVLHMPTFYVLGETHREGGPVLRFLRVMAALLHRASGISGSADARL